MPVGGVAPALATVRLRLLVRGAVQGVGFRPWVYRAAVARGLAGWVSNDAGGVVLEVEGEEARVTAFVAAVRAIPLPARVSAVEAEWLPLENADEFRIVASRVSGNPTAQVLPDLAPCPACLTELRDPLDRRHGYPFLNCTACGPRFSIVRALPYDRPNTSMTVFPLCTACAAEYDHPSNRRFHAQPVACPSCGPHLRFLDAGGAPVLVGPDAAVLRHAVTHLLDGRIVALKGVGGFQLLVDARNEEAVQRLRRRKERPAKPLALLVANLAAARAVAELDAMCAALLTGPEAPIVLLRRRPAARLAHGVAPGLPELGIMLPASPLHHLLAEACSFPLVATSGNRRDEPLCTSAVEAVERLAGIADAFLDHDRPIQRHVDDSVVRVLAGAPRILRRARGWTPLPVELSVDAPPLLALGGHLKNTVAVGWGRSVFLSQHVGDLETPAARDACARVAADFLDFWQLDPVAVVHDLHPDYGSTRLAHAAAAGHALDGRLRGVPTVRVQHHHAHMASCLAENGVVGSALGVVWDGTGYGSDGTVWGGEFLVGDAAGFHRAGWLRPFRLAGGEAAVRDARRVALALVAQVGAPGAPVGCPDLRGTERDVLLRMLERGSRAPLSTSAGRLFDAVAALLGIRARNTFEGEAAMVLEAAVAAGYHGAYPLVAERVPGGLQLDWRPALEALLRDRERSVEVAVCAARFHAGLVQGIADMAAAIGQARVALTGGCFQNRPLLEGTAAALRAAGLEPLMHGFVPPNDGGLALGQIAVAAAGGGVAEDGTGAPVVRGRDVA